MALAARLARERGVSVVSPWSSGPRRQELQPSDGGALMLVSMSGSRERIETEALRVRDLAKAHAAGPVSVQVTGVPLAAHDVKRASAHAIHRAELIALPVLLPPATRSLPEPPFTRSLPDSRAGARGHGSA